MILYCFSLKIFLRLQINVDLSYENQVINGSESLVTIKTMMIRLQSMHPNGAFVRLFFQCKFILLLLYSSNFCLYKCSNIISTSIDAKGSNSRTSPPRGSFLSCTTDIRPILCDLLQYRQIYTLITINNCIFVIHNVRIDNTDFEVLCNHKRN